MDQSFVTFGVGTEYHYVNADWFQMYSGLSVGYTFQTLNYNGSSSDFEDGSDSYFNFQVNALGFRFGKEFAGFLELGVGYRGIANVGVSYQF